eukprot:m.215953 g.215953  ORF g.215953 m.215953 type:complete len:540 (-) comp19111_c0_seq1:12-1631(-)
MSFLSRNSAMEFATIARVLSASHSENRYISQVLECILRDSDICSCFLQSAEEVLARSAHKGGVADQEKEAAILFAKEVFSKVQSIQLQRETAVSKIVCNRVAKAMNNVRRVEESHPLVARLHAHMDFYDASMNAANRFAACVAATFLDTIWDDHSDADETTKISSGGFLDREHSTKFAFENVFQQPPSDDVGGRVLKLSASTSGKYLYDALVFYGRSVVSAMNRSLETRAGSWPRIDDGSFKQVLPRRMLAAVFSASSAEEEASRSTDCIPNFTVAVSHDGSAYNDTEAGENCFRLLFESDKRKKLGYILLERVSCPERPDVAQGMAECTVGDMQTDSASRSASLPESPEERAPPRQTMGLSLRGMKVSESHQGRGLGRVFALIWILLCHELGFIPATKVMEKPLLCLLLQNLGFTPSSSRALTVEVSRPASCSGVETGNKQPVMILWSHDLLRLRNTLSKRKLRSLGMEIVDDRPAGGRRIHLHTAFIAPPLAELWPHVATGLRGRIRIYSAHVLAALAPEQSHETCTPYIPDVGTDK